MRKKWIGLGNLSGLYFTRMQGESKLGYRQSWQAKRTETSPSKWCLIDGILMNCRVGFDLPTQEHQCWLKISNHEKPLPPRQRVASRDRIWAVSELTAEMNYLHRKSIDWQFHNYIILLGDIGLISFSLLGFSISESGSVGPATSESVIYAFWSILFLISEKSLISFTELLPIVGNLAG